MPPPRRRSPAWRRSSTSSSATRASAPTTSTLVISKPPPCGPAPASRPNRRRRSPTPRPRSPERSSAGSRPTTPMPSPWPARSSRPTAWPRNGRSSTGGPHHDTEGEKALPLSTGFNHVATMTADLDRVKDFYQRAFEAEIVFEMQASGDHPRMAVINLGGGSALNVFEVPSESIIGDRRSQGGRGPIDHYAVAV